MSFLVHFSDAEDKVRKLVSPHFISGLLLLDDFVEILNETPNDISAIAVQRIMPDLLGLVKKSHKAFYHAESAIHQINDSLDKKLQKIVVEEKNTNDNLKKTQESLAKLEENVKVLQDEYDEVEEQLSKLDLNLKRQKESLRQRRKQLEQAERNRETGVTLGFVLGAVFGGALGLLVGGGIASAVHNTDVSNAEEAVNQTHLRQQAPQEDLLPSKKNFTTWYTNKKKKK